MCLYRLFKEETIKEFTAQKDLYFYKYLRADSNLDLITPYQFANMEYDKLMMAIPKNTNPNTNSSQNCVERGYFHGYYYATRGDLNVSEYNRRNMVELHKPVPFPILYMFMIPKGSKYILGRNNEICSNQIILPSDIKIDAAKSWETMSDIFNDALPQLPDVKLSLTNPLSYGSFLIEVEVEYNKSIFILANLFDKRQMRFFEKLYNGYGKFQTLRRLGPVLFYEGNDENNPEALYVKIDLTNINVMPDETVIDIKEYDNMKPFKANDELYNMLPTGETGLQFFGNYSLNLPFYWDNRRETFSAYTGVSIKIHPDQVIRTLNEDTDINSLKTTKQRDKKTIFYAWEEE